MLNEDMFTVDNATAHINEGPGITTDGDGVSIDWDEVDVVTVDSPAVDTKFGTNEFYRIPTTVARPVPQTYNVDGEQKTYIKPPSELRKAAFYVDNAPWTLNHPSTGMVARTQDVRGFWKDGNYEEDEEDLQAYLHFPTNDMLARGFLEENQGLSIGFYNNVISTDEYDGTLDSVDIDVDSVDGFQTDILINHISSVEDGRCSLEQGCGLNVDSMDGEWFESSEIDEDSYAVSEDNTKQTMCDKDTMIEIDDLALDAVAQQNDAVAELQADAAELREDNEELQAELDSVEDKASALEEKNEELRSSLDKYKRRELEPLADDIIKHSGRFDEDSKEDLLSRENLTELHEIVMDVSSTEKNVDSENEDGGSSEVEEPLTQTPW